MHKTKPTPSHGIRLLLALGLGFPLELAGIFIGVFTGVLAPCHGTSSILGKIALSPFLLPYLALSPFEKYFGDGWFFFIVLAIMGYFFYALIAYGLVQLFFIATNFWSRHQNRIIPNENEK